MKPTERFTDRVENYHLYRPGYAEAFLNELQYELKLPPEAPIAEIGSGTGILTKQLLEAGWQVYGIEPNEAMRKQAEKELSTHTTFHSINGKAESTTLKDKSVDAVFAAQAFHWFEPEASHHEFHRILRSGGKVVLVWNIRQHDTAFLKDYEDFLHHYSADYQLVDHQRFDWQAVADFFGNSYQCKEAPNPQMMNWQMLWGYYQSCSYALPQSNPNFDKSKEVLKKIFDKHANSGFIIMLYHTVWYAGSL